MNCLIYLVLKLICYHSVYSSSENEGGTVEFVNLLWRHGERNPVSFYPNDPYANDKYWPEGAGQLTNNGKDQHYELGQWLRKRYDSLLTDLFNPDRVYVQSTDVDRTIMSAQSNLVALYPPKANQVWDEKLLWQPIPVHTIPQKMDRVLAAKAPCPAYDKEFERVKKSKEIQQVYEKYRDLVKVIREHAPAKVIDIKYIHDTLDTLEIEKRKRYSLPKWAEEILPLMPEIGRYRFTIESWNKKLGRLKSGLLIQEMIENMKNRTAKVNERVVKIYSAHDLTIANLLNTLGLYDGVSPPYAACVMVELRKDSNGRHGVMIFYRTNSTTEDPKLLTLPGCSAVCPLDTFITLTKPLIPEDWDKECNS